MKKNNSTDCVSVKKSAAVEQCDYTPAAPVVAPAGTAIINTPVVLTEVTFNTSLLTNIHLPELALEMKDVKKRVKITQCRLMTPSVAPGEDPFATGDYQLYIEGFVRKNMQYASPCSSGNCISSSMKSFTTDVPFSCTATISAADFLRPVQLPVRNTRAEFDFFRAQNLGHGFPEKDQLLSSDLSQFHQENSQFYNKLPYCELVSHNIIEWDEATDRRPLDGNDTFEGTFQNVVEKVGLQFTVKVLQVQQVRVDAL